MFYKFKSYNRPIAPHLTVYSPQFSSLFSIWHRITGLIIASFIVLFIIILKNNTIFVFYYYIIFHLFYIFNDYIYLNILLFLIYHFLNGFRGIIWGLGLVLHIRFLYKSSLFIIFIVLTMTLISLLKYL